jgi:hypothetical protein
MWLGAWEACAKRPPLAPNLPNLPTGHFERNPAICGIEVRNPLPLCRMLHPVISTKSKKLNNCKNYLLRQAKSPELLILQREPKSITRLSNIVDVA